jgi:hypothetical protein
MAKVKVKYLIEMVQEIEWPDDELDNLTYDSLMCNCDPNTAEIVDSDFEIYDVTLNGKDHNF